VLGTASSWYTKKGTTQRMRFFTYWFTRKSRITTARGLLIPSNEPVKTPPSERNSTALIVRPGLALAVVSALFFVVYAEVTEYASVRLTQPASPVLITTQPDSYQYHVITEGVWPALHDREYFKELEKKLVSAHPIVISIDVPLRTLTLWQDGQAVVVAPVQSVAEAGSWRYVQAGYYVVDEVVPERYSSLEQKYYKDVVTLSSRVAIHGESVLNTGTISEAPSLGVQLSSVDAATVARLATAGTPVLVHTTAKSENTTSLRLRGVPLPVRSYIAAELPSGVRLATQQPDQVVPIASLTKLMTALVVAAEYDLEGEVTIDQEQYVSTLIPRLEGTDRSSVYDLLQLLLLESSNEAAELLASVIGRDRFIARMNEYAAEIGLTDTIFTDPSGLDAGNQSTANDLLLLTQYLYQQYPFILDMTAGEQAVAAARNNDFADLENYNVIDGLDTFRGGKVGETEAARQTSITIHEINFGNTTRRVALIVLGSESRSADVTTLHRYLEDQFQD